MQANTKLEQDTLEQDTKAKPSLPANARIIQVYRGKVGCCCGCKGTHLEGVALTDRILANIRRDLEQAETSELTINMPSWPGGEGHLCRERNGRYAIAYFVLEA